MTEKEDYYRWLVENSSDIISVFKMDGTILYRSPAVERLLGYSPDELVSRNEFEFIHPDDHRRVIAALDDVSDHRETGTVIDYRVLHKDGSWRYLESVGQTVVDESGDVVCIVNSRDITGRKMAEMDRDGYVTKLRERLSTQRVEDR